MDTTLEKRMRRPAGVDAVRVLSIGIVGWFHIWQQSWLSAGRLDLLPRTGYVWVDMMLLLSAFCLALPYGADAAMNLEFRGTRGFYGRRLQRILPVFYVCCGVHLLVTLANEGWNNSLWVDIFSHLTLTHSLFAKGYLLTKLGAAGWTVSVLALFYGLFPLLIRGFQKKPLLTVLAMVAGQWAYTMCIVQTEGFYYQMRFNQMPAFLGVFALGFVLAYLYPRLVQLAKGRFRPAFFTGAMLLLWPIWHCLDRWFAQSDDIQHQQLIFRMPMALLFGAFLLLLCLGMGASEPKGFLFFLAGLTYSFYLWHQSLAVWLKAARIPYWEGDVPPNQMGNQLWMGKYNVMCWALALLVAFLSTYLVEKPVLKLIKRIKSGEIQVKPPVFAAKASKTR